MRLRIVEFKHPNQTYWEVQKRNMILGLFPIWESVDKDGKGTYLSFDKKEEAEAAYNRLRNKYAKTEKIVIEEYDTSSGEVYSTKNKGGNAPRYGPLDDRP